MKTNENILGIEGGERFARIFTVTQLASNHGYETSLSHGAVLLAIAPVDVVIQEERSEWRNGGNVTIPADVRRGVTYIFGETFDDAATRIADETGKLRIELYGVQEKLRAAETAQKKAEEDRNLLRDESRRIIADKNTKIETLEKDKILRQRLEDDLAKVKKFFGEKAFNEALGVVRKEG